MGEWFGLRIEYWAAIQAILTIVLGAVVIGQGWKIKKIRRKYTRLMNGHSNVNIEGLLIAMQEKMNRQQSQVDSTAEQIRVLSEALKTMKGKVGIYRYNAFSEGGSDLSFSLAFMNEVQDGVVLTGIHSREQTYIYAKPVHQGQSRYTLTPEEKQAITQSLQQP